MTSTTQPPEAPEHPLSTLPPRLLRQVMAGYPTGIAVVAAVVQGRVVGLSANSFTSVSLDPPLVSISFAKTSTTWPQLRTAPRWGISLLAETGDDTLTALRRPSRTRFEGLEVTTDGQAAHLGDSLARLTVELVDEVDAGDHVLTLLRVLELERDEEQLPLVFFDSRTHRLAR